MFPQILSSCFIILALSKCCRSARVYNFSDYDPIPPQVDSYTRTDEKGQEVTYKLLKHGDPCDYPNPHFMNLEKFYKAKGHCRTSAGLVCDGSKCICEENETQIWDPKVQYITHTPYEVYDVNQLVVGKCAVIKGGRCSRTEMEPERGDQCVDDSICVLDADKKVKREDRRIVEAPWVDEYAYGTCQ